MYFKNTLYALTMHCHKAENRVVFLKGDVSEMCVLMYQGKQCEPFNELTCYISHITRLSKSPDKSKHRISWISCRS